MSTGPDGAWPPPDGQHPAPAHWAPGGYPQAGEPGVGHPATGVYPAPGQHPAPDAAYQVPAGFPGMPQNPTGYQPGPAYPPQPYPGPAVAGPVARTNPAASLDWRIRHSWWLLLPILGCSCLGGAGFLYIGLRARRPSWWIAGIVYTVVGWTTFVIGGEAGRHSGREDAAFGIFFAVWIAGIVHACLVNSSWLAWRAEYVPWYEQRMPAAPYPSAPLAPPPIHAARSGSPATVSAPVTTPGSPVTPTAAHSAPPPPTSGGPVDVNTAGAEQLAALAGLDHARARRVLVEREARRGFASVEEFVAVADLAPHEYARLRHQLVCGPSTPPVAAPPTHGRVLDV